MARRCQMLPISSFFDCSWVECDVDRGQSTATRNALERANLILEGYFQAFYVPLGGSETRMESSASKNTPSKSMKFYISMFNDKPPCMSLCFGIVERHYNQTARGSRGFFFFHIYFLSLCTRGFFFFHIFFLSLCNRGFLFFHIFFLSLFFNFFFFFRPLIPLPLLS